jgi:hypothetical protein
VQFEESALFLAQNPQSDDMEIYRGACPKEYYESLRSHFGEEG